MNQPDSYLQWSIFKISYANLIVILIMLAIFALALIVPFVKATPADDDSDDADAPASPDPKPSSSTHGMWTARVRQAALRLLPPDKILPDKQPAYVASWIYVFGVATIAAFILVVVSGLLLAIGGPDWWHTGSLGHFVNSLHLWGVELFLGFMVVHLWGKFWMAAWRGKRWLTWVTGVVAFAASIVECFTGYLSQQNFDSQWIATNGKDAINSTGLGGVFNLMNFGQMLLWHAVFIPIILVALIAAHVLFVRVRGVSHPISPRKPAGKNERQALAMAEAQEWKGPHIRYDILKEGTFATIIVAVLVILLAGTLSSPDEPPVTIASWAKAAPADFMATAASELAATSETATYGPPYSNGTSQVQSLGISLQQLGGVNQRIDTAQTFVLSPLSKIAPTNKPLATALSTYESATVAQQSSWNAAYATAVAKVKFDGGSPILPDAHDGPIPLLISTELTLARSGALDSDLIAQNQFFGTNYTKPLLFLEDGNYFASLAQERHLTGDQWGAMNETGRYPGQPWLWLYTLWYQIPGISTSKSVDLIAIVLTGIGTILLLAVPFIPGLRDIPYLIPIHRLIWRKWNKDTPTTPASQA